MIVTNGINENSYGYRSNINNNSNFNITFPFCRVNDIAVYLGNVKLTTNQYIVTTTSNNNNIYGVLTIIDTAIYESEKNVLTIKRETPISQLQTINSKTSLSNTIENGLDKLTFISEDLEIKITDNYNDTNKAIERLEHKTDELSNNVEDLRADLTEQQTEINTAKSNISALQIRMTKAEADIDTAESDISDHETKITALENAIIRITAYNVTVPTNWSYSADTELYSQTISVPGIKATDLVLIDLGEVSFASGATLFNTLTQEYNKISLINVNDNSITVNCSIKMPELEIPIILRVFSGSN